MDNVIEIKDISFVYPQARRQILDKCTLNIGHGELVSILGPNGAGKSTLLNCACNLLTPQSGEVLLNGKNIKRLDQRDIAKVIAYVQQYQQSAFSHTVFDYVLMGRANNIGLFQKPTDLDKIKVNDALCQMGIAHLSEAAITEISGGERQQAAIARAIVQDPQVIFFDEPTAHLDYGNQIRARSDAQQTFLVQLTNGAFGYLPTEKAEKAGHYSAYVSSGSVGHEGGELLVDATLDTIHKLFS